jgi:hypothetical protein
MMSRTARCSLIAVACVLSPMISRAAAAQLVGKATRAAEFAPVDASALGATRGSSIGLSATDIELVAGGGTAIASGSLHGYVGAAVYRWSTGLAFSRTVANRSLAGGIRATLGSSWVPAIGISRITEAKGP